VPQVCPRTLLFEHFSALFDTTQRCFRAGLANGKLLISRSVRSEKWVQRTNGRSGGRSLVHAWNLVIRIGCVL